MTLAYAIDALATSAARKLRWCALAVTLVVLGGVCACDDLSEFRTEGDAVYRGSVVGGQEGAADASFVRRGFPARTEVTLRFDPDAAYRAPGELQLTFLTETGSWGTRAALVPLAPLAHDLLSQYDFPGEGRLRNYIFGATLFTEGPRGQSPDAIDARPRDLSVYLSLMADGSVEMRLMTPTADLFGVFAPLRRSET